MRSDSTPTFQMEGQSEKQVLEIITRSVKCQKAQERPLMSKVKSADTPKTRQSSVNNGTYLLSSIAKFFNNPLCSDVQVQVNGSTPVFYLHRLLLARSDVLQTMLLGQYWSNSRQTKIMLEEAEFCVDYMDQFFRYFYTGEINLNEDNVAALMVLANKYNLPELEESCYICILDLVFNGTSIEHIIDWWIIARQLNLAALKDKCHEYIILNLDMVLKSELFLELELEDVCSLLSERNLVVSSETALYCAVWKWLGHQSKTDENLVANFKQLMSHIHFNMMSTEDLISIESNLPNEFKDLIHKHLLGAFKFHAVSFDKRNRMGIAKYDNPRLYTGSKGQSLSAGVALNSSIRPFLSKGVSHRTVIPVSLSEADKSNVRDWKLVFQETEHAINLEVSTATTTSEHFGMIEASILLYKTMNNITFVKGVMQFRIFQGPSTSIGKTGHVFSVSVPPSALEENNQSLFRLVTRHYTDKQLVSQILQHERP